MVHLNFRELVYIKYALDVQATREISKAIKLELENLRDHIQYVLDTTDSQDYLLEQLLP